MRVLEGMATAFVRCMEPWWPPLPLKCFIMQQLRSVPRFRDVPDFVMCCDAAMHAVRYRAGVYIPKLRGVRTVVLPGSHTQESAEWWALVWMLWFVVRLHWKMVVLVSLVFGCGVHTVGQFGLEHLAQAPTVFAEVDITFTALTLSPGGVVLGAVLFLGC